MPYFLYFALGLNVSLGRKKKRKKEKKKLFSHSLGGEGGGQEKQLGKKIFP